MTSKEQQHILECYIERSAASTKKKGFHIPLVPIVRFQNFIYYAYYYKISLIVIFKLKENITYEKSIFSRFRLNNKINYLQVITAIKKFLK